MALVQDPEPLLRYSITPLRVSAQGHLVFSRAINLQPAQPFTLFDSLGQRLSGERLLREDDSQMDEPGLVVYRQTDRLTQGTKPL